MVGGVGVSGMHPTSQFPSILLSGVKESSCRTDAAQRVHPGIEVGPWIARMEGQGTAVSGWEAVGSAR